MALDIRRSIAAAVQAALEDPTPPSPPPKKSHLSAGRALLLGAGLVTAGRLLVGSRGRDLLCSVQDKLDSVQHSLLDHEGLGLDEDEEEAEAEEAEEAEEPEEPEAEEDFDDEAAGDEDLESEEDYEGDEEPVGEEPIDEEPVGGGRRAKTRGRG